jgi:hypothetical protein
VVIVYTKKQIGLHLQVPKTDAELVHIATMYASQNPPLMISVDIQKSVIEFKKAMHSGAYLRLILLNEEIQGFIGGSQINTPHTSEKTVQQLYYYCKLEGLEALRALVITHEGLIKYAEGLKAKYVLSPCSQFYYNDNLCRILKTQGWQQFGYIALWRTSHHSSPSKHPRDVKLEQSSNENSELIP